MPGTAREGVLEESDGRTRPCSSVDPSSGGELLAEPARALERCELVVAAHGSSVDEHEGNRPATAELEHPLPKTGIVVERDLLERDAPTLEQRPCPRAVAAPGRGVELYPRHAGENAGGARRIPRAQPSAVVPASYIGAVARSSTTEAVVLRSFRLGEADRVLHVYTRARGRVGAVAKGVRKTRSRFGGRLEPFSHVELVLHQGRGELETVTGASLIRSHDPVRSDSYRLRVGTIGLEAMLRLFTEQEANDRAFLGLTRFLDALDGAEARPGARPALDPLVLSFQLKLLWVSGYLPHLSGCVECERTDGLVAFLSAAGGTVCAACDPGGIPLSAEGLEGIGALLRQPIATAPDAAPGERARRDALAVVTASYEHHGGFRLRTLSA